MTRRLLGIACLAIACAGSAEPPPAAVVVGGLDAIDAELARHRGHGVLLNFWATWCGPCVAELPELLEVERELRDEGVTVVLVSFDAMVPGASPEQAREQVAAFVAERGIGAPNVVYDAPDYEAINDHYDLPGGIPVTLAIDADGRIVDLQDGQAGKARFTEMARRALGPAGSEPSDP